MRRAVAGLAAAGLLLSGAPPGGGAVLPGGPAPAPAALLVPAPPPPLTAPAWILYDDTYRRELASHQADQPRAMASTTKMMTALVALEEAGLEGKAVISRRAAGVGESEIGLAAGEEGWTVRDLLAALLVASANDAAVALAEHIAGSVEDFAEMMNARAEQMGLEGTRFLNPHGLDQEGHYSTARDLLAIARAGMENPDFAGWVGAQTADLPADRGGEPRAAVNTNRLLAVYPGAIGIKTGYTDLAGLSLAAAAERDGRRLYAVVLGSEDHFAEAAALFDYGFREFGAATLVERGGRYRPLGGPLAGEALPAPETGLVTEVTVPAPPPAARRPAAPATTLPPPAPPPSLPAETAGAETAAPPREAGETARPDLPGMADAWGWVTRYLELLLGRR